MPEFIPTSTEAEWLAARRKGITASEIAIVMGISPYSSPYALWHQKLDLLPAPEQEEEQEFGTFCEPYIAGKFAARHPEFRVYGDGRQLYRHSRRPWQMATPDRLLAKNIGYDIDPALDDYSDVGLRAVLECKSDNGSDEWGDPGTDEIPAHYRAQVLWQMDVMGVPRAHVACLGRDRKVREYVIEHHPSHVDRLAVATPDYEHDCDVCKDIVVMLKAAGEFLACFDLGEPPDIDWRPATSAAIKGMHPEAGEADVTIGRQLAISYRAAVKHFKAAERRKDEMTNRVLAAVGDGRRAVLPSPDPAGEPVATRSVSHPKRIDTERLRAEQPEIAAAYTKPPRPEVKLTLSKPKKDKK